MSWLDYIWPFGPKHQERRAAEEAAEKAFKEQLEEAKKRQGDLESVVEKLRRDREMRIDKRRRASLPSFPTTQESGT